MNILKRLIVLIPGIFSLTTMYAQFEDDMFSCDEESYSILKNLSDSQLGKGSIYLFTTTHQDLAWLNDIDACIADRDTLWLTPFLKRLEEDPTFKMDIEQTSIVMEYLHRHPETKPLFDKYIKQGRICIGGTFIQPYEEMYSGESLARQFYLGTRWLKKTFDGYTTLSYFNVDVPGRTLQMPQIMKKAGVDNLVISRQERGLFYWKAPDGSKVRTYSPGHYIYFYDVMAKPDTAAVKELGKESVLWYTRYNDVRNAHSVMPAMLNYELMWDQKPVHNTPVFIEKWNKVRYVRKYGEARREKINLPKFEYATADNFFNALDASTANLPETYGERPNVWLYIHGPSHEKAVTKSRQADMMLPAAEALSSFRALLEQNFTAYPVGRLAEAWKAKIYPDHGWGGVNGVMTDNEFRRKYEYAYSEADNIISQQINALASYVGTSSDKGRPVVVFNTLSFGCELPTDVEVRFEEGYAADLVMHTASGSAAPVQLSDVKRYADGTIESARIHFVADVPPMGLSTYYLNPSDGVKAAHTHSADATCLENDFYKVDLAAGGIRQIFDKSLNRNLLKTDKFLGGEIITMHSYGNGAGEFDAVQQPDMEGFDKTSLHSPQWEICADGPVFTSYKMRSPIRHAVIEQTIRIYHGTRRIDFDVELLNWESVMFREFRMMLPLDFGRAEVSYEVPFGALTVGKDEMPGAAGERYYVENKLQHPRGIGNWISASSDDAAVTLSSSVAVADYIDPTDMPVDYTILQPVLLASRQSCHYDGNSYFQPGDHSFRFSLTSHEKGSHQREICGVSANAPLMAVYQPLKGAVSLLKESTSFVEVDNPEVMVTAFKKCEDDNTFIIRLYNKSDREQVVSLDCFGRPYDLVRTTLIEEEVQPESEIRLGKYAIETYKLKLKHTGNE